MLRAAATFALPVGFAACALLSATTAQAKASYMDLADAAETADAIAVIHTEATGRCEIKAEHWTYSQKVFASPKEVLKGELAASFELLAQKNFECASVQYEAPADYLVMLRQERGHWTTVNHNMGALRVEGEQVQWPYGADDSIPLSDALTEIRALVGEHPVPEVVQPAVVSPEPVQPAQQAEPQPCGYAVSQMQEREEARERWILAGAVGAGAGAVMLGFVFGFRRRRRA